MPNNNSFKVDCFIIGAPKCATTSMCLYLSGHKDIVMTNYKDSNYFSPWHTGNIIDRPSRYRNMFKCGEDCGDKVLVDSSVLYFCNHGSIDNILKHNPEARFIVILRNPIDLILSYHDQKFKTRREDEPGLEQAWAAASDRLSGKRPIPPDGGPKETYDYKRIGMLGMHLENLYAAVDPKKVKVLFLEDIKRDTRAAYVEILDFLGLEDDGKRDFPIINKRGGMSNPLVYFAFKNIPNIFIYWITKHISKMQLYNITNHLPARHSRTPIQAISNDFEKTLIETYRNDIHKLEKLTGRNLSHWLSKDTK